MPRKIICHMFISPPITFPSFPSTHSCRVDESLDRFRNLELERRHCLYFVLNFYLILKCKYFIGLIIYVLVILVLILLSTNNSFN